MPGNASIRSTLQFGHGCDAVETAKVRTKVAEVYALQFGHGCDAVETRLSGLSEEHGKALQFGHGCDAVETSIRRATTTRETCFNSATVVTPWKPFIPSIP